MELLTTSVPESLLRPADLRRALFELDHAGYWRGQPARVSFLVVAFTVGYALLAASGYAMARTFGDFVAFWPAAGLLAGVVASTPVRTWPLWIASSVAGRLLADAAMPVEHPVGASLVFAAASVVEALLFAILLGKALEQSFRLGRPLYLMTAMCLAAVFAGAAGSALGAGYIVAGGTGEDFMTIWGMRLIGDYLGMVIVGSLVAWLLLPQIRIPVGPRHRGEYFLYSATVAITIYVIAIGVERGNPVLSALPGLAGVVAAVPLFWAALRFDYPFVALGLFALAIAVNWVAGQPAFAAAAKTVTGLPQSAGLQLYLVVVVQLVLFIAYTVLERERAGRELSLRRGLEHVLVHLSGKLARAAGDDVDDAIDDALRRIAKFADADRCMLFQMSRDRTTFAETHGWYGQPGARRKFSGPVKVSDLPVVRENLERNGYYAYSDLEDDALAEFDLPRRHVSPSASILYIGLFSEGALSGCLGLDWLDQRNPWNRDSRSLLYLVGQLFANVLKRINAEFRLEQYHSKLRSMVRESSLAEDRMRRKVAADVHDGIAQNLAVARITIGKVLSTREGRHAELEQARDLIDSALNRTRNVIADLSPAILYELGFVPAVRALVERFELGNRIAGAVEESGEPWPLSDDLKGELYRTVRELLANVTKHASAGRAVVRIDWQSDGVRVAVEDDGVGFDAGATDLAGTGPAGFGLFSVREGIDLLGGRFDIESARGIGTTATFHVPRSEATP